MSQPALESRLTQSTSGAADRIGGVVLCRIASASVGETELARDLQPFVGPRFSASAWRTELLRQLTMHENSGRIERQGGRIAATDLGRHAAAEFLGTRKDVTGGWPRLRDGLLVAKALGLDGAPQTRLKALAKADGLRLLIVESAWALKLRGRPSAARVRSELAVLALGRAFGNQIAGDLDAKSSLPPKAARLLAGQLAKKPRDFKTDSRLVAALAAEAVGAAKSDLAHLRLAVVRRFIAADDAPPQIAKPLTPAQPKQRAPRDLNARLEAIHAERRGTIAEAASQISVAPPAAAATPQPIVRPDPAGFARAVNGAARVRAEGWAGNRKTFVSHVWSAISQQHPEWGLSEIEFKCMLTEAHRMGLIALANADLKDNRREFAESAVIYKNTIWHYVRVED
jgi:hypothetical protein